MLQGKGQKGFFLILGLSEHQEFLSHFTQLLTNGASNFIQSNQKDPFVSADFLITKYPIIKKKIQNGKRCPIRPNHKISYLYVNDCL